MKPCRDLSPLSRTIAIAMFIAIFIIAFQLSCNSPNSQISETSKPSLRAAELTLPAPVLYPTNSQNLSFGDMSLLPPGLSVSQSFWYSPDLIAAESLEGGAGYIRKIDLYQYAKGGAPDILTVYKQDGVTKIGTFRLEK